MSSDSELQPTTVQTMETNYKAVTTKRGVWIFIDGKHKKTLPAKYAACFDKLKDKIGYEGKRLRPWERDAFEVLFFEGLVSEFKQSIMNTDRHLFAAIRNCKPVGARYVNSKNGNRYELKFDNGFFVRIPQKLYTLSPNKLDAAFLNY